MQFANPRFGMGFSFGGGLSYTWAMSKIKVEAASQYPLKDGGYVYYFDVGNWSMELIQSRNYQTEIEDAKHAIKVYKAWLKYLKKINKR